MRTTSTHKEAATEKHTLPHVSKAQSTWINFHLFISILTLLLLLWGFFMFRPMLMQHEYAKVWWKENYEILMQLQKQQIDGILQYYKSNPWEIEAQKGNPTEVWPKKTTLDLTSLGALKEEYPLFGNSTAEITWIEYSDLECPYCKQQNENKALENINQKYSGKVAYMFKHFPLNIHPGSQKKHEALECIKEQKWDSAYFAMKDKIFEKNGYQAAVAFSDVESIATELWADLATFTSCIDEWKYTDKVRDSISEGKNYFSVSGTPATVIINNSTGEFRFLNWVQSEASIEEAIKWLLQGS